MTDQPPCPPIRARMTLKVSRDSGRSWGPLVVIEPTELPAELTLRFPPCACAQHQPHQTKERAR